MRSSISKASTFLDEEWQLALTEDDFVIIQLKMDKIDQKLNDLYRNWQAEYKNAVTPKDCKEVKRFYKSFLEKYESKYRILHQMLQHANRQTDNTSVPSAQESTPNITCSLVALDDAQALMRKEWRRGEPGVDIPRQYSTLCGHLTPKQPRHEDMRMDSNLNVTPEGSLSNIPAATRGNVNLTEAQQMLRAPETEMVSTQPSTTFSDWAEGTPYTSVKVTSERASHRQRTRQTDIPRRVQRIREASQEDALASARHFFAPGNGQNQVVSLGPSEEVPITTTSGTTLETSTLAITSTVPTTSTTTTATEAEIGSPISFLPNMSPSRPTVTATCRPQTWVQRISEGWTSVPPPDGTESEESDLHKPPLSSKEEVPENLGHKWRVLHPFKLPGVRQPTDTTSPNQRRLAENDALVELIKTTEYL